MSDDGLFAPAFSSEALRGVFSGDEWLKALLDFEVALARVQERAGKIPRGVADALESLRTEVRFDLRGIAQAAVAAGNPVIPFLRALSDELPPELRDWIHFGATSQDALDTAFALLADSALGGACTALDSLANTCGRLAAEHRDTPMAARTLLQHALPTTFGLKVAGWLNALLDARERLGELRARGLAIQLGGAAGTLAALEPGGLALARELARELGLAEPLVPWHSARGRVAEIACALGVTAGVLGKIALDVALLAQTEVGELRESLGTGRGGSSTLPQKRNPVGAASALACAKRVPGLVATILAAMPQEHERAVGGWQAEWETLPEIFRVTSAAAEQLDVALVRAEIDPGRMRANLDATRGAILAERLALELAPRLGRHEAHEKLAAATRLAAERGSSLREVLAADPAVAAVLDPAALERALDPAQYLGAAGELVDRVLARHRELCERALRR
jgi:3-carboxy-cis,cis-muconate cycloisomerase